MNKKTKIFFYILFAVLFVFYFAGNIYWIYGNNSVKGMPVDNHLLFSIEVFYKFSDIIHESGANIFNKTYNLISLISQQLPHKGDYDLSNFIYLITTLFYSFFGKSLFVAKISNYVYVVILSISIFFITKKISCSFAGIVSMFSVLMYPLIFESIRQYGPELPLTAITALVFLCFLQNNIFGNFKYSFIFGLAIGIGLLIKLDLLVFIIVPLPYTFYTMVKRKNLKKKDLPNILIFIVTAASIASIWCAPHFVSIVNEFLLLHCTSGAPVIEKNYLQIFTEQIKMLVFSSISFPLFILSLPGIYFFLKSNKKIKYVFLCWILFPIFFFTFTTLITLQKYLMPILPAIAIITSAGIHEIRNRKIIITWLILLVFTASFQFYRLTFDNKRAIKIPNSFTFWGGTIYGDIRHTEDDYKINEVIKEIQRHSTSGKTDILSVLLTDGPRVFEMRYWIRLHDRSWNLLDAGLNLTSVCNALYYENAKFDFIIVRIPATAAFNEWPPFDEFVSMIRKSAGLFMRYLMSKSDVPEKSYGKLYEKLKNLRSANKIKTESGYSWLIYKTQ